ncbi:MAG: hypothetical protein KBA16_01930 [Bacteroidia bacterium]|nr:hypothetical protein [Bacteroidia bacterium]MBP7436453.1 hypothetical protein [Bacteroidia bacterium]MBP7728226.1 hypothetical protein [Bacteroidia bacterium]MBP7771407.1 hypothetical protein [Bacteroidia bacterium]
MLRPVLHTLRYVALLAFLSAFLPTGSKAFGRSVMVKATVTEAQSLTTQDQVPTGKGLRVGRLVLSAPVLLLQVKQLPAGWLSVFLPCFGNFSGNVVSLPPHAIVRASHRCTLLQVFRC